MFVSKKKMLNISIKNSYNPLSTEELDEILTELRINGGLDDPLFLLEEGEENDGENSTSFH